MKAEQAGSAAERARRDEPCRQIHLDFHTSELIAGVGSGFDRRQFQEALKAGRVAQINLFGKCHHSWCYYPTRAGKMHPTLSFDLLGAQIEACHEIGVRAPIYVTVGWSARDAEEHPEWCQRERDGRYAVTQLDVNAAPETPRPVCSWKFLCPNSPYHELVMAHADELCRRYPVDGLWFDIYQVQRPCFCAYCLKGMRDAGIDPRDAGAALRYWGENLLRHQEALKRLILGMHPEASVYFNGTTSTARPQNFRQEAYRHNTKNDLEDLPTTWGGYDKLPLRARIFHAVGRPVVAMSGKFHTSWGEFGGFKHRDALRYEAACMIANGVCCNFGDQAHPDGHMDETTYANIGHAFSYVEKIEAYGVPGRPVSDIALWFTGIPESDEGVVRMLLETQHEFEVVRSGDGQDLQRFRLLIVPGGPCLDADDARRIAGFAGKGGRLLVIGGGALDADRRGLVLDVGADLLGPARFQLDYTRVGNALAEDLPRTPFLHYEAAWRYAPRPGADTLAEVFEPYFDRTYGAYCSHQNTPNRTEAAGHPTAFRVGNVLTLAHDLGTTYYRHGARVHRQLFRNALRLLLPKPMLEVTLPSAGRATLLHQPGERRHVVHLTYAPPMKRGRCEIIEDIVPLHDVAVTVRLGAAVRRVYTAPEGGDLPVDHEPDGSARVLVPRLEGHVAVVFEEESR